MDIRDTILARLRGGENAIDIANEYAEILNEAIAEYEDEKAKAAEAAALEEAKRKDAITSLTKGFNDFFSLMMPGVFDTPITNDMMSEVMNLVSSAFDDGARGYTVSSHSETGKKPVTKVVIHNDVDGKIAKFLEKNGLK